MFYPSDYTHAGQVKLYDNYVRNVPVASRNYLVKGVTHYEMTGAGTDYSVSGNYSRAQIFSSRQADATPVTSSHALANAANVMQPSDVNEGEILSYDSYGNIATFKGKDGVLNTVIWGYKGTLPVAKVIGDTYSNAVAKLSSVNITSLQSISDPATLRTKLDEIRQGYASNVGVQVFTYTYMPLIGLSSETDHLNRTTYYEYDGFGRLIFVRDKDNNIIKRICYNYAGQVENCGGGIGASSCNGSNCIGENKKCINGVCETGTKVCTSSIKLGGGTWQVTYHYVWSDSSVSQDYTVTQIGGCFVL
jgi:YD repeat-containing protein